MEATTLKHRNRIIAALLAGIIVTVIFRIVASSINVYEVAVVGAIFELLSLPVVFITFGVPLVALYFWYREYFRISSVFLYLFLLSGFTAYFFIWIYS